MQVCKTCGANKPADAYFKQKSKRSGLFAECKVCQRQRNQKWIDDNRERFRHLARGATNRMRRRDPVRSMIWLARSRAKKSGLEFTITQSELFIPAECPVLGIPLTYGLGKGEGQSMEARDSRASLDRIDNSKGYVPGNVVVVSYRANRLKSDADVSELLKLARFYAQLDASKRGALHLSGVQPEASQEGGKMPQRLKAA
jgi:hypothetical protein